MRLLRRLQMSGPSKAFSSKPRVIAPDFVCIGAIEMKRVDTCSMHRLKQEDIHSSFQRMMPANRGFEAHTIFSVALEIAA